MNEKMIFPTPSSFKIKSAQREYPVEFSPTVEDIAQKVSQIKNRLFIIDQNVRKLYGQSLEPIMNGFPVLEIEATEDAKTFGGIEKVLNWLSENKCTKANHLVAIGGGIIQDITTFSTCIFFRGIPWTLVPTTLLSMSDSSIGAKCGINLKTFKNQLGVFNSPYAILITPEFLKTLSIDDIKSGYGEILKLHLTGGFEKFVELEKDLEQQEELLSPATAKHIYDSLMVKKKVIEEDEYESDLRRILNYGHTFGHALEAETNHFVPHGLGVIWGIDFVNFLAFEKGWLEKSKYSRIKKVILNHFGFKNTKFVSAEGLLTAARRDKKAASASEVNMVYFTENNCLEIKKTALDEEFKSLLERYLLNEDVFYRS